jgi:2-polyprenyl-6-methoxyphenol hydroxylase-like FAD-dependent oxidoreductase
MAAPQYDVIVVGARCAGSPTAMLLARKGYRVLVVDRATFPSDTISTHLIHPPGMAALRRWGLFDRLIATGCPAIHTYKFDMGPVQFAGTPGLAEEPRAYAPRRTVLDKLLLDAAAASGVEVREGFTVDDLVFDGDRVTGIRGHGREGHSVTERAPVLIGADGVYSTVARAVAAPQYHDTPQLQVGYYSYWSGVPLDGHFEAYDRGDRVFAVWPTHDDLTLVVFCRPIAEFERIRKDVEGCCEDVIGRAPAFAERLRAGRREERFAGMAVPNFFRKPYGPGWALVGDAGYNRDFITAQGISDAFRDAELCAQAVDDALSGARSFDDAMASYQAQRDARALPMYEFTCQFARLEPPPPEMQQLFAAIPGNQRACDGFAQVMAGVISPAEFFSPENVQRIFSGSGGERGREWGSQ